MSNLEGLRKEYLATDSFRMILQDALDNRPQISPYRPEDKSMTLEEQQEFWKSRSAMQDGFDLCFKYITGKYPGELT